jgi:hypothetical protein
MELKICAFIAQIPIRKLSAGSRLPSLGRGEFALTPTLSHEPGEVQEPDPIAALVPMAQSPYTKL